MHLVFVEVVIILLDARSHQPVNILTKNCMLKVSAKVAILKLKEQSIEIIEEA
jgi:hypothetical protein